MKYKCKECGYSINRSTGRVDKSGSSPKVIYEILALCNFYPHSYAVLTESCKHN